ncbi:uncharacterized protein MONOS_4547 [Monocercomonoides exilis]|uniref:uncharacterized protein n=1 Tax=Monocercomonoides exilis TaxID=2049356 RepID=UPI00355A3C82|nr:hypothetical protein MONOS_4547 [Monocercomonoides exilis]|eukprot:MONOS_4547.1-p1 / transcript=MONOS_4547.1 / gene=MONOS_4547 / organism=Monocercomonoides_exilis_PA203 / gene_product=unspecified product / transcript_product=unspecified product / location=Mono_scaffold00122:27386-27859(+) / protein_length=158 / sequence_SO=supercontig / SO=protein_coding / is_pseudo=false
MDIKEGTSIKSDEWRGLNILEFLENMYLNVWNKRQLFIKYSPAYTDPIDELWDHLRYSFPSIGTLIQLMHDYLFLYLVDSSLNITFSYLVKHICVENDEYDDKEIEGNLIEADESEEIAVTDDILWVKVEKKELNLKETMQQETVKVHLNVFPLNND